MDFVTPVLAFAGICFTFCYGLTAIAIGIYNCYKAHIPQVRFWGMVELLAGGLQILAIVFVETAAGIYFAATMTLALLIASLFHFVDKAQNVETAQLVAFTAFSVAHLQVLKFFFNLLDYEPHW